MTTILDKIIDKKREEVALLKQSALSYETDRTPVSFYDRVVSSKTMALISEVKRASPSKGDINLGVDPVEQAKIYADNGADAVSVLTDTPFFKGTMDDLKAVKANIPIPVLNKDFIIDEVQIDRAYASGGDIILLIAAALNDEEMNRLYRHSKEHGLDVLVEVHDEAEMERALKMEANIIGINNRNLHTFETNLSTTERLLRSYGKENAIFVSESGIKSQEDAIRLKEAGAKALLVGETLMRAGNVAKAVRSLKVDL
ncbi:indole-3-glycerol phosphate synthase TrpC [Domibacillus epiphyticus]|uniref:Indole-3-glycerol phosphate synthase n=1 Tax=Domibacillus epiphyticus TaxID=1714355 RepID=A0A1V2A5K5_9BACI|nr:indole-3-glycerol phosphate synthase TrpC [Domibacillus epiphyticus]OMP66084.1 indole-3-glycerol phosphate synthase [Domibacillus epiphyticus]